MTKSERGLIHIKFLLYLGAGQIRTFKSYIPFIMF